MEERWVHGNLVCHRLALPIRNAEASGSTRMPREQFRVHIHPQWCQAGPEPTSHQCFLQPQCHGETLQRSRSGFFPADTMVRGSLRLTDQHRSCDQWTMDVVPPRLRGWGRVFGAGQRHASHHGAATSEAIGRAGSRMATKATVWSGWGRWRKTEPCGAGSDAEETEVTLTVMVELVDSYLNCFDVMVKRCQKFVKEQTLRLYNWDKLRLSSIKMMLAEESHKASELGWESSQAAGRVNLQLKKRDFVVLWFVTDDTDAGDIPKPNWPNVLWKAKKSVPSQRSPAVDSKTTDHPIPSNSLSCSKSDPWQWAKNHSQDMLRL